MSKFVQCCLLGLALTLVGCGGSTPELGAAKETPKMSPEEIQKKMMESANRNNSGDKGTKLEVPAAGGENK